MFASKSSLLSLALCATTVTAWPSQSFKTVPFAPPVFNVTKSGEPLAPGLLFIATTATPYPASYIVTDDGELVWSSIAGGYTNFKVQTLDSDPVLTFWNGTGSPNPQVLGHGYGKVQILDSTYTELNTICPDLGLALPANTSIPCHLDLHESYVTDRGTLLVSAYNITQADLTPLGGAVDGYIFDSLFFEIDIKTQDILFSWSALKNGIPISDSKLPLGETGTAEKPFDYFHINSIQSVGSGYFINSRHIWTTYMLDSKGEVEWAFEGSTGGDFTLPEGLSFAWEHDTRVADVTSTNLTLHMFDNENAEPPFNRVKPTLGLVLSLDLEKKTSRVLKNLTDPKETLYADSQGSLDVLPNGNVIMGYGQIPKIKEYGPSGDVRLSIQFGDITDSLENVQASYRAYRLEWEGVPAEAPVVVAEGGKAYMSWNGATDMQSWEIFEGASVDTLTLTKTVKSSGFETEVSLLNSTTSVKVNVIAKSGKRGSVIVPVSMSSCR